MESTDCKDAITGDALIARPLVADLDGTLIRSDLLVESTFKLLKRNILFVFLLPLWLLRERPDLKHDIVPVVDIDVEWRPDHEEFLYFLKAEYATGCQLVLATAFLRVVRRGYCAQSRHLP